MCGYRDIVLEIEKYAYYRSSRDKMPIIIRDKMPIIYNFFRLLPGVYIEIGIDLIAENRNNMNPKNLIDWSFFFIKRLSEGLY